MSRYLVTIFGKNYKTMADLVSKHKIEVLRQTAKRLDNEVGFKVDALVDSQQIQTLKANEYKVEIREDIEEIGKARQAEIGKGNRYK